MSELSEEARAVVEAGRAGDDPAAADRARMRSALFAAIAAGGAAGGPGSGVAKGPAGVKAAASSGAIGAKAITVIAILGVVATGALLQGLGGREPTSRAAMVETSPPPEVPAVAEVAAIAPPTEALPVVEAEAAAIVVAAPAKSPAREIAAPARAIAPPAREIAAPRGPAAPIEPAPSTLEAETRRLGDVQGALAAGDASRALALLDEQSRVYAGGQLEEERAAAKVLALCELGRSDEARAAAVRFHRDYPRSPLAGRVNGACAARE